MSGKTGAFSLKGDFFALSEIKVVLVICLLGQDVAGRQVYEVGLDAVLDDPTQHFEMRLILSLDLFC